MSRSGYTADWDGDQQWAMSRYRGAVKSAIKGKRGQEFLKEMVVALDNLPEKKLVANYLVTEDGCFCAMGAVASARGVDTSGIDPYDREGVAGIMGIAEALSNEIAFENDGDYYGDRSDEARWSYMRNWAEGNISEQTE